VSPPAAAGPSLALPQLTAQPVDQTVSPAGTVTFATVATGGPALTVQWQVSANGGRTFSDIPGATSSSLTLGGVVPLQVGDRYRAVYSDAAGSDTSASARVLAGP